MGRDLGLRINDRIENDIKPFLIRNYLWDKENDCPNKSSIILEWFEKKEDITDAYTDKNSGKRMEFFYWHLTQKGKEGICKLINNLY